ncbi:hypothetical protein ACS5PU_06705 [Pedobacter sp. GSP4]|uniref:hypothetical protein n=1 Tax=Pedobacter sp. GSP4 TaxID=3453716 RepID=UPI003EE83F54
MYKLTLIKGTAMACLILMYLFLVEGCKKELLQPNSNVLKKSISVEEAKQYFEQNILKLKPGTKLSSTGIIPFGTNNTNEIVDDKLPMWDASQLKDLSIGTNAILTPLYRPGVYIHISEKRMVKYGFLNYLMMCKDSENKIITEWVELKPSEKWIDAKFSRKYDGKILVKDWDGRIKMLYNFSDGVPIKTTSLKKTMLASVKDTKMDAGNSDIQCFVTTTTTIKTSPKTCPCLGHTYEQAAICKCTVKPEKGYQRTIQVTKEYDCDLPFDPDKPTTGTGNPGGTGETGSPNTPGGGTPNPGDYTPISCNPDPNYVVPTTPPPPGMEYILPCSSILVPTDGTPLPGNDPLPTPKSTADLLLDWFNSDPDLGLHLSVAEATFLNNNPLIANELFLNLISESSETKEFGKWAVGYLMENSNVNVNSIFEFREFIINNPLGLISDAPCDLIKKWIATANFSPDLSIRSKLDQLKNSRLSQVLIGIQIARIQKISDASSPIINMDYFPVTINELPIVNNQRLSADQFLHYLRVNLDQFTNQSKTFKPYNNNGIDDRDLWYSNNPKGSIIALDISGPENASVITSKSASNGWTFTTIYEPMYGDHPVSGHRDFGYITNANGTYTFFTRGVDRLTKVSGDIMEFLPRFFGINNGVPFSQADGLWNSLQVGIKTFVDSHGGSAIIDQKEIKRTDWTLVKDVMEGRKPLSALSKKCPD